MLIMMVCVCVCFDMCYFCHVIELCIGWLGSYICMRERERGGRNEKKKFEKPNFRKQRLGGLLLKVESTLLIGTIGVILG